MEEIIINTAQMNKILPVQNTEISHTVTEDSVEKGKSENNDKIIEQKEKISVDLSETVKKAKEFVNTITTKLTFEFDPQSDEHVIYVRDQETGKVIRQIPPEEMIKLISSMDEIAGILFNRRA